MPRTIEGLTVNICDPATNNVLATGTGARVYFDGWLFQVECTLVSGAHNLAIDTAYTIRRSDGGTLASMYHDQGP